MTDWTRVPVLVGAGQHTNREEDPTRSPDPIELMAMTATLAAADLPGPGASAALAGLTHCWTVHSLSLRHSDPAGALAGRIGAGTAETRCSGMGGNIPQWLVDRAADLVVAGSRPVVLIAGAEALATRRRAKRQGITLEWPGDGGWPDTWPPLEADLGVHPAERAAGLEQATTMYALVESAISHAAGRDGPATATAIGAVMERFNAVAADNPYSWFPTRRSAGEIATVTADNRVISHPYPKYVNAVMDVDMGAAVLLTDAQRARDWGLGPDEVVYIRGWADAHDIWYLSERPEVHRAHALRQAAAATTEMAGIAVGEIGAFDLYSCFPSSVEAALDALGVAADDPRPLTLTGGLPYHGGPGSNYVTHCVANALAWLRDGKGDHALVHGNGYYLTKHAVGLYSRQPPTQPPVPTEKLQDQIDGAGVPVPVERSMPGPAQVVAYTVGYDREGSPLRASLIAESAGRRTAAVADEELTGALLTGDGVATPVTLEAQEGGPDLSRSG